MDFENLERQASRTASCWEFTPQTHLSSLCFGHKTHLQVFHQNLKFKPFYKCFIPILFPKIPAILTNTCF